MNSHRFSLLDPGAFACIFPVFGDWVNFKAHDDEPRRGPPDKPLCLTSRRAANSPGAAASTLAGRRGYVTGDRLSRNTGQAFVDSLLESAGRRRR